MAKEYILVQITAMQSWKEISVLENQVALVQRGSKKGMSPGQSKKKATSIHCKHSLSGTPKILAPIFFSIYTSNLLNIRFVPKKKQNQMEFIYQLLFNLLFYQASGSSFESALHMLEMYICIFNLLFQKFSVCCVCKAHMMVTVTSQPRKQQPCYLKKMFPGFMICLDPI